MRSDTLRDAVVRTAHPCDADGHVNMRAVALATLNPLTPQDNDRRASEVAASAPDAVLLPVGARVTLAPDVVVPFADGHARSRRPWEGTSEAWGAVQLRDRGAPWASVTVRAALGWAELHRVAGLDGRGRDAAVGAAHGLAAWAIQACADAATPDDVAVDLLSERTSRAAGDAVAGAVAGRIVDLARALADRWPSAPAWRAALAALAADEDNDAAAAGLLTLATETCERDGVTVLAADAALADVLVSADNGDGREAGAAGRILAASAERVATWMRGDPDLADLAGAERSALAPGELWRAWWGGEPSGSPSTSGAVAALAFAAWRAARDAARGATATVTAAIVMPLAYRAPARYAVANPTKVARQHVSLAAPDPPPAPGLTRRVVADLSALDTPAGLALARWFVISAHSAYAAGSLTPRDVVFEGGVSDLSGALGLGRGGRPAKKLIEAIETMFAARFYWDTVSEVGGYRLLNSYRIVRGGRHHAARVEFEIGKPFAPQFVRTGKPTGHGSTPLVPIIAAPDLSGLHSKLRAPALRLDLYAAAALTERRNDAFTTDGRARGVELPWAELIEVAGVAHAHLDTVRDAIAGGGSRWRRDRNLWMLVPADAVELLRNGAAKSRRGRARGRARGIASANNRRG